VVAQALLPVHVFQFRISIFDFPIRQYVASGFVPDVREVASGKIQTRSLNTEGCCTRRPAGAREKFSYRNVWKGRGLGSKIRLLSAGHF
jgi:hypothetical protein